MARTNVRRKQATLEFRSWGGARANSGRKRVGPRARVGHKTRAHQELRHPVHVTTRLRARLPSLRRKTTLSVLELAFSRGADRFGFRLVHYAIRSNHLHLIAEAADRTALARGMQGLLVRVARALNKHWVRRGSVFADRYHARALCSPREVRAALVYVLHNARHHGVHVLGIDPFSSGPWFDGWARPIAQTSRASPCVRPRSWLLRHGWRRRGRIECSAAA